MLTKLQKKYVMIAEKRSEYSETVQRQYDFRIRQKALMAMRDLALLVKYLPDDQQDQVFTIENVVPLIACMLSFKAKKEPAFEVLWKQKRRFPLLAQLHLLSHRMLELFNKQFFPVEGQAITPMPWEHKDGVIFSITKKPFGEGISPIALFKPGEPLKYARAKRDLKEGEELSVDDFEFVPWDKVGEGPEPIRLLYYDKVPLRREAEIYIGTEAEIVRCNKQNQNVFLGTCKTCEFGNITKCEYREKISQ